MAKGPDIPNFLGWGDRKKNPTQRAGKGKGAREVAPPPKSQKQLKQERADAAKIQRQRDLDEAAEKAARLTRLNRQRRG